MLMTANYDVIVIVVLKLPSFKAVKYETLYFNKIRKTKSVK